MAEDRSEKKLRKQLSSHEEASSRAGAPSPNAGGGGGNIFSEPVLVINQKTKLIEVTTEFKVFDQAGNQIGFVRQVGQGGFKKLVRFLGSIDQFFTHRFEVLDMSGSVVLRFERPAKLFKSRVVVSNDQGVLGEIVQQNVFGKIRFLLESNGQKVGEIQAENWRAWNFAIVDANDAERARITKTFEGVARTLFTTADSYVLSVHGPVEDPLRSLIVASALAVDVALKQDNRGLG